jgi:hypothetical protein
LVLNGIALALVSIVAFYPIVLMIIVWEFASMRSHWIATLARAIYGSAVVAVGVLAWRRADIKLALLFVAMLGTMAGVLALVHWRW